MSALDEEFVRAGLFDLFSERAGEFEGEFVPAVASAIHGLAESDGGIAATYLARVVAALPWKGGSEAAKPLVDGWSALQLRGHAGERLWAWGWRAGSDLTVCVPAGDAWRFELVPAPALDAAGPHERMGLRACASAWVGVRSPERTAVTLVSPPTVEQWRAAIAGWWSVIALARARAAICSALEYAASRYQGGKLLQEHEIVRALLGRALQELSAAEALLVQGFAGDVVRLAAGASLGARAGEWAAHAAQQVFGGYGYMRDYPVERCLRDTKMAAVASGVVARMRAQVAAAFYASSGARLGSEGGERRAGVAAEAQAPVWRDR